MSNANTDLIAAASTGVSSAPWSSPIEDHPRRWVVYLLLVVACAIYAVGLGQYYTGAHGGTDQNGYLMTARLILEGHLGWIPDDPLHFVGRMNVLTPDGWVFAKYPFGYPLLAAIGRWVFGLDGMYLVNPACTVLACFLSYFLFRTVVGNFASLMGVIWLACNPVTLNYAHDANSHAPTLLCVVVGAWGLFTWWHGGGWWRGFLGGLAMGYACTIRYTEFLLVLPLLFVAMAKVEFSWRKLIGIWPAVVGWCLPIAALAIVHWVCYGAPWLTGYSLCKEQTGFGWVYFLGDDSATPPKQGNWQTLLYQLNHSGLFLIWPVCIGGMTAMFWYSWRLATAIALWVVPPTVLYMFYYWAPQGEESVGYLRFFLTVFPGMILAGIWLLDRAVGMSRAARALSLGALTALGCGINLANITPNLENHFDRSMALRVMREAVQANIPPRSVIFAEDETCNHLDAVGGWKLYELSYFRPGAFSAFRKATLEEDMDDPTPVQRTRSLNYLKLFGVEQPDGNWRPKPQSEVEQMHAALVDGALDEGRRVMFIFRGDAPFDMLPGRRDLRLSQVATWRIPSPPSSATTGMLTRWKKGVLNRAAATPPNPSQLKLRTWTIYELVRERD